MWKKSCLTLSIVIFLAMHAQADTFEFLTYTPPAGWAKQTANEGMIYRRATGIGLVYFYPSYASTGSSADEFAKIWTARVVPTLPGPGPKPQVEPNGDYSVAVGTKQVDAQGTIMTVALVTIVGRGRAIGVLAMAAGDDVMREVTVFLDSVKMNSTPAATTAPVASGIDVDFEVPKGYTSNQDGSQIVIKPASLDRNTPCIYGFSPSRASTGVLEKDARAAILEPLPNWQLKSEKYDSMRGTAGAGWQYFWYRSDVQQMTAGTMQNLVAMAMAFPNGPGRVGILWGFGPAQHCTLNDVAFLRIFHTMRPRGFQSDGGKAFAKELVGTWRNTESVGMAQYSFRPNGTYEYGQGTSTTFSTLETRTGSAGDGNYTLRGSELTLTGRRAGKYLVLVYEDSRGGTWRKAISVLNESASPPLEVRYMRVD